VVFTAAILAGGLGTRLRPAVADRPKVMASVAGRPFVTYLLDQLIEAGIRRVVLCTGYLAESIRYELGTLYRGIELVYSVEAIPLGTGGALRQALNYMADETLLVLNGDSYCQCSIAEFVAAQAASCASAGMVLAHVDDTSRFGGVQVNDVSLVESFVEKNTQAGSGWINAGIYLLPTASVREIPSGQAVSLEREVIPRLLQSGLYGYRCSGLFIDIGVPEEYQRAQSIFSDVQKGKP